MNSEFWHGKTVFLTGHTGFKGSWLSLILQNSGARVSGFSLPAPTDPSLFDLAGVAGGMDSHIGDIRDAENVAEAMQAARPDVVLHLAAQPLVRYSYEHPLETFHTNVVGTANVLDAVRRTSGVRAVVVVTSDKCYHNREWAWGYREDEPMGGADPYSASKGCTELVAASYRASYFSEGTWLASARAGNVIGGGDFATDRLMTDFMAAIRAGEPVKIRNPDSIRPWQHVLEPLNGYLMLAERLWEEGEPFARGWNFGPSDVDARPVSWICDRLVDRWDGDASWVLDVGDHPHEASYLKLDSSMARQHIGWQPKLDLAEALDWIVSWHHAWREGNDVRETTLGQIRDYLAR